MLFSTHALLSLILLVCSAVASELQLNQTAFSTYYLKTLTGNSTNDHCRDGLYVASYHTGAGLSDVVLTPNISIASHGFLNGTKQQFKFGAGEIPWALYMATFSGSYGAWDFTKINIGRGTGGFFIDNGFLQRNNTWGFGGWLACDWWHGAPQLFWLYSYYNYSLPGSCSRVDLEIIPA